MDLNLLKKMIDKYEYISFDIYDTLLKRYTKKETDIFRIVENIYYNRYGKKIDFLNNRIEAEKISRKRYVYTEVNYDEIYKELENFYDKDTVNILKNLELEIEDKFLFCNEEMYEIYNYALSKGKEIYIISDMYLRKSFLEKLLRDRNYNDFKNLYVSGEYRITKSKGTLYKYILERENINPERMLHIGDNRHSDIKMAKKYKINTYFYDKKLEKIKCNNKEDSVFFIYKNFLMHKNRDILGKSGAYKLGYNVFGILLYVFAKWIYLSAKDLKCQKIYFLSRDGYILEKVFNIFVNKDVQFEYIYMSRNSIISCLLDNTDTIDAFVDRYKSWPKVFDINYFLEKINKVGDSKVSDLVEKISECEFNKESIKNNLIVNEIYDIEKESIKEWARYQKNCLINYLNQDNYQYIAVVDLGGRQTIQKNLREFIQLNGLNKKFESLNLLLVGNETKHDLAFLYAKNKNNNLINKVRYFYFLLEAFFTAPHPSVREYTLVEKKTYPVFEKVNNKKENKVLNELHAGAIKFVEDFYNIGQYLDISLDVAINDLFRFGLYPDIEEAYYWKDYKFDADGLKKLIQIRTIKEYIENPIRVFYDYKQSLWKTGYIKLLFKSNFMNYLFIKLKSLKK